MAHLYPGYADPCYAMHVFSQWYKLKEILHYKDGSNVVAKVEKIRMNPFIAISATYFPESDHNWARFWCDHDPRIKAVSYEYTSI